MPGTPPGGPNAFIFMQFSAKSWKNNPTLRVGAPLRKILDPPLVTDKSECVQICWSVSCTGITIDLRFDAAFTNSRPASSAENELAKRTESKIILVKRTTNRGQGHCHLRLFLVASGCEWFQRKNVLLREIRKKFLNLDNLSPIGSVSVMKTQKYSWLQIPIHHYEAECYFTFVRILRPFFNYASWPTQQSARHVSLHCKKANRQILIRTKDMVTRC